MKILLVVVALVTASSSAFALEVLSRGQGMCSDGRDYCMSLGYPAAACNDNYNRAMSRGVWPSADGYPAKKCFRTEAERARTLKHL